MCMGILICMHKNNAPHIEYGRNINKKLALTSDALILGPISFPLWIDTSSPTEVDEHDMLSELLLCPPSGIISHVFDDDDIVTSSPEDIDTNSHNIIPIYIMIDIAIHITFCILHS